MGGDCDHAQSWVIPPTEHAVWYLHVFRILNGCQQPKSEPLPFSGQLPSSPPHQESFCRCPLLFLEQNLQVLLVIQLVPWAPAETQGPILLMPVFPSPRQGLLSGHTDCPTFPAAVAHGISCSLVVLSGLIFLVVAPITI